MWARWPFTNIWSVTGNGCKGDEAAQGVVVGERLAQEDARRAGSAP